jgi:hypothetical protein
VDPAAEVHQDQLENPLPRLDPDVGEEDAGVRVSGAVCRVLGRKLYRVDGVDDEPVRVVDVDLAVAGGDDELERIL